MPVTYRHFRNPDPPGLVRIWNESFTGRGAAFLQGTNPLEHFVLSRPYFDRQGLIVAEEDGQLVGLSHAGFGSDKEGNKLALERGVTCLIAVLPSHRRQGIGTELLRRSEEYLRCKGATRFFVGAIKPFNPFYWGLYGGSEPPGILASDSLAEQFLTKRGYRIADRVAILDRSLDVLPNVNDQRFIHHKRNFEFRVVPRPVGPHWFAEVSISPLEVTELRLVQPANDLVVARARWWDMDLFGWRWHQPSAGIFDVEVRPELRRQGLGKFLMLAVLNFLQDQFYTLVEVQTMAANEAANNLYRNLGFVQVDEGRVYEKATDV